MTPEQTLKIDNLLAQCGLMLQTLKDRDARDRRIDARLAALEKAAPVPVTCGHAWACARLGISDKTGRNHPEYLPPPLNAGRRPLKYSIEAVEEKARQMLENPLPPAKRPRPGARRIA